MELQRCTASDRQDLRRFLAEVDLTLAGLDEPEVRLWIERDDRGDIVASTGYELGAGRSAALIRSVAVGPTRRGQGRGSELARFALARATAEGATTAWLFSRRSGPFWRGLGFECADRDELAALFASTAQVRLFTRSGQLGREVAWSRPLQQ